MPLDPKLEEFFRDLAQQLKKEFGEFDPNDLEIELEDQKDGTTLLHVYLKPDTKSIRDVSPPKGS